jgi:hypothetical protein
MGTDRKGESVDMGSYTMMVNCLQGLLSKIGLEKKLKPEVHSLAAYVAGKKKRG